jgi:hypothetical protein
MPFPSLRTINFTLFELGNWISAHKDKCEGQSQHYTKNQLHKALLGLEIMKEALEEIPDADCHVVRKLPIATSDTAAEERFKAKIKKKMPLAKGDSDD